MLKALAHATCSATMTVYVGDDGACQQVCHVIGGASVPARTQGRELQSESFVGGAVQVQISITGGGLAELESLDDWLRRERELAGRVTFVASRPREGELGAVGEALIVAVSSGGALSVLAASLKAWISLPRHSDIRIKILGSDGRAVEVEADRVSGERVDDLIRQVLGSWDNGK